jgi:hypothetical protein
MAAGDDGGCADVRHGGVGAADIGRLGPPRPSVRRPVHLRPAAMEDRDVRRPGRRIGDPGKRLMAIANYNTNLAEYWQMAGTGFFPIDSSNESFKLGVNYMLYGLTH